jgi:hypothetical protein
VSDYESDFLATDLALGFRRIVEAQRHELSLELRRSGSGDESSGRVEEITTMRAVETGDPLSDLRLTAAARTARACRPRRTTCGRCRGRAAWR